MNVRLVNVDGTELSRQENKTGRMRLVRSRVQKADKESIDELEGKKWTGGLYTLS